MKEIVIQHFFEGHATVQELATDSAEAFARNTDSAGTVFSQLRATRMNHEFALTTQHLVKLVEAVQTGGLNLEALDAIAFCLEASDQFTWDTDTADGDRVARSLFLLGTPEVNYPLTARVLAKIHHYLLTGEETFTNEDLRAPDDRPGLLTVNEWNLDRDV